jgi:hypothetical protein
MKCAYERCIQSSSDFHFLPRGYVEQGEFAEATMLRGLRGETGAGCRITLFFGILSPKALLKKRRNCLNHLLLHRIGTLIA